MIAPVTDHDRILVLQARVAELEAIVAAYEANALEDAEDEARAVAVFKAARALRPLCADQSSVPGVARLALHLLARPGQLCRYRALGAAVSPRGLPLSNVAAARVFQLRYALRAIGFGAALLNVRGEGYVLAAEAAPLIAERLGIGHD